MRLLLALAFLLAASFGVAAQAPRPSEAKMAAMKKLDMMVGQWKGRGWWEFRPGMRNEFDSEESVARRAGGTALELIGMHSMQREGRSVPVHDAFAMLWYDEPARAYRMKSAVQTGHVSEFEITVFEGGYAWSHPAMDGKGTVRYRATIGPDTWKEVGEQSADGAQWRRVFEMELKRAN
jgi:hypothetical protein